MSEEAASEEVSVMAGFDSHAGEVNRLKHQGINSAFD